MRRHRYKKNDFSILSKIAKVNFPTVHVLFDQIYINLKRGKPQPEIIYSNSIHDTVNNYKTGYFLFNLDQNIYENVNYLGDYKKHHRGCFDVILSTYNKSHITFKFRKYNNNFVKMYLHKCAKNYILTKNHYHKIITTIKNELSVRRRRYVVIKDKVH